MKGASCLTFNNNNVNLKFKSIILYIQLHQIPLLGWREDLLPFLFFSQIFLLKCHAKVTLKLFIHVLKTPVNSKNIRKSNGIHSCL